MARAKRTDRTEARRRHRADTATSTAASGAAAATAPAPTPAKAGSKAATPTQQGAPRPSVTAALRGAFRPVDLRGDLRALPRLLLHWSFWGPAAATIVTTIVYIVLSQGRTGTASTGDTVWMLVNLAFQMFVFPLPAPAGASFIAGFGAPRAAWLIGVLIGLVSAVCFAIVLQASSATITSSDPTMNVQQLALQGFLVAPIGSALFAAAAAWYKRFLNLANPNRSQRRQAARPAQGRGDIQRDRLSH